MGDKLKPGHFVPRPEGETDFDYSGFADSMAQTMEKELDDLLDMDGLPALKKAKSDAEVRALRALLVAIARGVVIHLRRNADAFRAVLDDEGKITVEIKTTED